MINNNNKVLININTLLNKLLPCLKLKRQQQSKIVFND